MAFRVPIESLPKRGDNAAITESFARPTLHGRWLDAADQWVGDAFVVDVPEPVRIEVFDAEGRPDLVESYPAARVEGEPPEEAVRLVISDSDIEVAFVERTDISVLRRPSEPIVDIMLPEGATAARVYVLGDRFGDDAADFIEHARALHDYINSQVAPFNQAGGRFHLTFRALLWPSHVVDGVFGTKDPPFPPPRPPADAPQSVKDAWAKEAANGKYRVIDCDTETVSAYLRSRKIVVDDDTLVVIVVKSKRRLGAGGLATSEVAGWRPVVVTNSTESIWEKWQQVAVHEIGHAFGLIDEYSTDYGWPEPTRYEPNVSALESPHEVQEPWRRVPEPWKWMVTGHEEPGFVRLTDNNTPVGAIVGARYSSTKYYRPSLNCMMRDTGAPFCPVCEEVIATELAKTRP